jgi:Uncharacterized protein conserved in bacteria
MGLKQKGVAMLRLNSFLISILLGTLVINPAKAHKEKGKAAIIEVQDPRISLEMPRVRVAQAKQNSAGFIKITNKAEQELRLLKAETDAASVVELHISTEENGVHKMRPVEYIRLVPQETVELKSGSYHIMLLNLKRPLKEGEEVPVTLYFSEGAPVTLNFPVKKCCGSCH